MNSEEITLPTDSIFTVQEVQQFRGQTAGTKNVNHLNNAGSGLMPDPVTQAQLEHIKLESELGGYEAAASKADVVKSFYLQASLLFNCRPENVAFTASATDSFTRALSAIPFEKGDTILTDRDGFVSNQIQFLSLQKRIGIKIVHIANSPIGGVDTIDLLESLHKHRPRLLSITHIPTNSGLVQPVNTIAQAYGEYQKCHQDKTWYILDACQSAGQMKLDVKALGCDFMSLTCRKFLRGPRGTGALYVSDRALDAGLEPMFIDMRGAEWIERDQYKARPDAVRFEDWEFAYSTVLGTAAAIEYCRNVGEHKIWQQVKLLSGITRHKLTEISRIRVLDRGPELAGLVTFTVKDSDPVTIVSELLKMGINVVPTYRAFGLIDFDDKGVKWAVRASPHYYNTLNEIDSFVESVEKIIR